MMNDDLLAHNRVILCHFDSYSAALLFTRFGSTTLAPTPLPEGASAAATASGPQYGPRAVLEAVSACYGLDAAHLNPVDGFDEWTRSDEAIIRVHLARFTTFEAPRAAMEPHGGIFAPISQMRGAAMLELNLLRRAFNLFLG